MTKNILFKRIFSFSICIPVVFINFGVARSESIVHSDIKKVNNYETIKIDSKNLEIKVIRGTFYQYHRILQKQLWWNNPKLARKISKTMSKKFNKEKNNGYEEYVVPFSFEKVLSENVPSIVRSILREKDIATLPPEYFTVVAASYCISKNNSGKYKISKCSISTNRNFPASKQNFLIANENHNTSNQQSIIPILDEWKTASIKSISIDQNSSLFSFFDKPNIYIDRNFILADKVRLIDILDRENNWHESFKFSWGKCNIGKVLTDNKRYRVSIEEISNYSDAIQCLKRLPLQIKDYEIAAYPSDIESILKFVDQLYLHHNDNDFPSFYLVSGSQESVQKVIQAIEGPSGFTDVVGIYTSEGWFILLGKDARIIKKNASQKN